MRVARVEPNRTKATASFSLVRMEARSEIDFCRLKRPDLVTMT